MNRQLDNTGIVISNNEHVIVIVIVIVIAIILFPFFHFSLNNITRIMYCLITKQPEHFQHFAEEKDLSASDTSHAPPLIQPEPSIRAPSLFFIKTVLQLGGAILTYEKKSQSLNAEECHNQECILALSIWKAQNLLKENAERLAKPASLEEYEAAFPPTLSSFFAGLIETLLEKKHAEVERKRKAKGHTPQAFNHAPVVKVSAFLSSVVLTNAFKKRKFGLHKFCQLCAESPNCLHLCIRFFMLLELHHTQQDMNATLKKHEWRTQTH